MGVVATVAMVSTSPAEISVAPSSTAIVKTVDLIAVFCKKTVESIIVFCKVLSAILNSSNIFFCGNRKITKIVGYTAIITFI